MGDKPITELVARLRQNAEWNHRVTGTSVQHNPLSQAANEIERLTARLAEAERDAARYAYFKRANVLTIDWIIGLPVEEWDTEVDRWIGKEQWRAADSAEDGAKP